MDAQPDDDDALYALDPLEVVERVLTAENLVFDRTEDGEVTVSLTGDWKEYELWFAWRPEADCLQLYLAMDMKTAAVKARAQELVNLVNPRVWMGHFELWGEEGEVVFRHALGLPEGERPTPAQTAAMIDSAIEAADRFYPAFNFLITADKSPQEAMDACLFETVGEA